MSKAYKDAGVDLDAGDDASRILYEAAKATFANRKGRIGELIVPFDDFSGVRAIDVSELPEGSVMNLTFDGVGTKAEVAQRMNKHDTLAFDLFAMVCDDAIVRGAEPVTIGSVLDVNSLGGGLDTVRQLAKGYVAAAAAANVAVVNGEIAELGDAVRGYGRFAYNWCSGLVWFARKEKLFTGKEVKPGDAVVLFREKGFRSNGLSLVRKILKEKYGEEWHETLFEGEKLGSLVLAPSTIYCKAVVALHGGFDAEGSCTLHGVAHITGGGLPEKLGRVLKPSGLGAELDDLFSPCAAMLHCQELGGVSDEEAYRVWNMGQGLAVITPEPEKVIKEASLFGIEAKRAGTIVTGGGIRLKSQGSEKKGEWLTYG